MRGPGHQKLIANKIEAFLLTRNRVSDDCLALLREVATALKLPETNHELRGFKINQLQEQLFKARQTIGRLKQALWETDKKRIAAETRLAKALELCEMKEEHIQRIHAENHGLRKRLDNAEASLTFDKGVA